MTTMVAQARKLADLAGLSAEQRHVLLVIADTWINHEDRTAYPSVPTIMRKAKRSEATVRRWLRFYEQIGILIIPAGGKRGRGGRPQRGRRADLRDFTTRRYLPTLREFEDHLRLFPMTPFDDRVSLREDGRKSDRKDSSAATPFDDRVSLQEDGRKSGALGKGVKGVSARKGCRDDTPRGLKNGCRDDTQTRLSTPDRHVSGFTGFSGLAPDGRENPDVGAYAPTSGASSASRTDTPPLLASTNVEKRHRAVCRAAGCPGPRPFAAVDFAITFNGLVPEGRDHPVPASVPFDLERAMYVFEDVWGWCADLSHLTAEQLRLRDREAARLSDDLLRVGFLASVWEGDARFDSGLRAAVIASRLPMSWAGIELPRYFYLHMGSSAHDEASDGLLASVVKHLDKARRWGHWPAEWNAMSVEATLSIWATFSGGADPDAMDADEARDDPALAAALKAYDEVADAASKP